MLTANNSLIANSISCSPNHQGYATPSKERSPLTVSTTGDVWVINREKYVHNLRGTHAQRLTAKPHSFGGICIVTMDSYTHHIPERRTALPHGLENMPL